MISSGASCDVPLYRRPDAQAFVKALFFVYCFLVSIDIMGLGFKAMGAGFSDLMVRATTLPIHGLIIGIVTTSIVQSSSSTTSIVVALVGAGMIPIRSAVPIVMGANIGTTVTNMMVSFGYIGRKREFERSFGASIVHDLFNILSVLLFFPLEMAFGLIYHTATFMESLVEGVGGLTFTSPLKFVIRPLAEPVASFLHNPYAIVVAGLVLLFFSLSRIVTSMRGVVMEKMEKVLNVYLFRNVFVSIAFGMFFTAFVQSSSITTSLIVPLAGAGLLTIEQIFPYTLGANIGTTITALLASLSVGNPAALTVALCHFVFNIFGTAVFLPLKIVPITAAKVIAGFVARSKKNFFIFLGVFVLIHILSILLCL